MTTDRRPIAVPRAEVIVGAPGSGKTQILLDYFSQLVEGGVHPDRIRLITPSRRQASQLRDELGVRVARATRGALAVSLSAFAFGLIRSDAEARGLEVPRLRSGADVDQDIAWVLAEQERSGSGPRWPEQLSAAVRGTEAFRTELRELIARLTEWGLGSDDLRNWAEVHPAWIAAADFLDDYERTIARSRPHDFDSAELLRVATSLVNDGFLGEPGYQWVLFDDYQDMSPATAALVQALASQGVGVVLAGDPDVAAQTFRGADPEGLSRVASALGLAPRILTEVYRHGPTVRAVIRDLSGRIGTALLGPQRQADGVGAEGQSAIWAVRAPSAQREAHDIARALRQRHLDHAVAYRDMTVVVRRAQHIPLLAMQLEQSGIPTHTDYRPAPAEHPASRELVMWALAARHPLWLDDQTAQELLGGVFAQIDPRRLRRLRGLLRVLAQKSEDSELGPLDLRSVLTELHIPDELPPSFRAPLERVCQVLRALREIPQEGSAALVLSTAWQAWGVEDQWVSRATAATEPSLFHREGLEQLQALLSIAERFSTHHSGVSPEAFFLQVLANDISEDVIVPTRERQGVLIATPSSLPGTEFDTVILSGLVEHVWPNTRLRWSLLGAPLVTRAVRGQLGDSIDQSRMILDDELRMAVLALSRAREAVWVTAVDSEDSEPSPLFRLLADAGEVVPSDSGHLGSPREWVAESRLALTQGDESAAEALAHLHRLGIEGAHPDSWWGLPEPTTSIPLFQGREVAISPSKISSVEESSMDWFLDRVAPDELPVHVGLGTLVHWALEQEPWGSEEQLRELVGQRFGELEFDSWWLSRAGWRSAEVFCHALAGYLRQREGEGVELVGSEFAIEYHFDGVALVGSIDRIERDSNGRLIVVDVKTGQVLTAQADIDNHPQMQAYQLALSSGAVFASESDEQTDSDMNGPLGGAHLVWLASGLKGQPFRVSSQAALDEQGLQAFRSRLIEVAQTMARSEFSGPRHHPRAGGSISRHRWQRVRSVCSD